MQVVTIGLVLLAANVVCADENKATPLSEPVTSTASTQPPVGMTEEEVRVAYLKRFRTYCRSETACTNIRKNPILEVINGTQYNMTSHICLWGAINKNCPHLCVNRKVNPEPINCLGKPHNSDCQYNDCYHNCNKTHGDFSEPYGSYWTICNATDDDIITTVQPGQHTEEATTLVSKPTTISTTTGDVISREDSNREKNRLNETDCHPKVTTCSAGDDLSNYLDCCKYPIAIVCSCTIVTVMAIQLLLIICSEKVRATAIWVIDHFQMTATSSAVAPTKEQKKRHSLTWQCSGCAIKIRPSDDKPHNNPSETDSGLDLSSPDPLCQECRINMIDDTPDETTQFIGNTSNGSEGSVRFQASNQSSIIQRSSSLEAKEKS